MKMNSLEDLCRDQLADLYDAEQQILKALPKMMQAASNAELKRAFATHEQQTSNHVARLEQVFQLLGVPAKGKTCKAMKGLIEEGQELMSERADPSVMDAGLIAAAQKVEHYEMAGYGCLRTWATQLGYQQAAQLFQETLNEEEQTDKLLTQLAERVINVKAAS
jgi:ferritin-like metal-binding protein YciE